MLRHPPSSPLFPYTTLFRSGQAAVEHEAVGFVRDRDLPPLAHQLTGHDFDRTRAHWPPPRVACEHDPAARLRSEEQTSELQSPVHLVCRLLLEKKKNKLQHR